PRTVFPGEDAPSTQTVFRRFNWFLLGGYGIHTSVFSECARLRRFCGGIWHAAGATRKTVGVALASCHSGANLDGHRLRPLSLCCRRGGGFFGEPRRLGAGFASRTIFARLILLEAPHILG